MPRIDATLRQARSRMAAEDAEALLAYALDRPRSWLYAHGDDDLDEQAAARFGALLERRASGEPVAYLTGRRGFWSLELQVTPATLIPRPETELLVEIALARLPRDRAVRVADLGTGSGAIALALAHERRNARVVATDASKAALEVARDNASRLDLQNVEFRHGDWLVPLAGDRFDLIASNPPYIADTDEHLCHGDLRFEPAGALASGADGLDAIRRIASGAGACLVPGGWLLIEHGWRQGAQVRALLQQSGLVEISTQRDLALHERVSLGRAPPGE
ncbi:MAG: peptide chain release factor N(5)-glutamine methyltransferase [Pseudomonadota bacterium]|nr:peptide chain release factor N(5)-glutamine methyltransferase [Pseudomonadota bacterium]